MCMLGVCAHHAWVHQGLLFNKYMWGRVLSVVAALFGLIHM
jgi:hypothetical protein